MARTDSLGNFLTDVADAIREKKGTSESIQASDFDTEIESISGGGDVSEYFNTEPESVTNSSSHSWIYTDYFKKLGDIIIPNNVTNLSYLCHNWLGDSAPKIIFNNNVTNTNYIFKNNTYVKKLDVSGFNTSNFVNFIEIFSSCQFLTEIVGINNWNVSNAQRFTSLFENCARLERIDLSNWEAPSLNTTSRMFVMCSQLKFIDVRKLNFTNVTSYSNMFNGVPSDCLIIVKDQVNKDWFASKFSSLTNVQTVEEYEASL